MKRIFVSSTFKDMHEERDLMHYRVLPALNEYAKKTYGESMELCDLRWGINTGEFSSEEASLRVLSVCLDEVESCRPYMIVILGDRYGWIPEEEQILNTVKNHDNFLLQDLKKSVTALEIEFGALQNQEQLSKTLFYFRTIEGNCPSFYRPSSEEDHFLQENLKATIRRLAPDNVREYHVQWNEEKQNLDNLDTFETMITNDIKHLLEKEWEKNAKLSPIQKTIHLQADFANQKAALFGGREWAMERVLWHLKKGTRHLLITGDSGAGKTTIIGALSSYLNEYGWETFPLFVGIHAGTDTAEELLHCLIWQMEEKNKGLHYTFARHLSDDSSHFENKFEYLKSLIDKYTQISPHSLAFLIDGLDDVDTTSIRDFMQKLFDVATEKVAVICSSSSHYNIQNAMLSNHIAEVKKINLYPLGKRKEDMIPDPLKPFHMHFKEQLETNNPWAEDDGVIPKEASNFLSYQLEEHFEAGIQNADIIIEKKAVIQGILKHQKKELDSKVIHAILEKNEADSPFYLSLLIQRLIMMNRQDFSKITELGDGIDNITAYQLHLIEQAPETIAELCVWIMDAAIAQIGNPQIKDALYFLSMTDTGLLESELEILMLEKQGSWNALDFTLLVRYMGFAFTRYNDGRYTFSNKILRDGFRKDCKNPVDYHKGLLQYIKTLSPEHMLRTHETITHCFYADDKAFCLQHITHYQVGSDELILVMEELRRLIQSDSSGYSFDKLWQIEDSTCLHWLTQSFESAQTTELCDKLIAAILPFAEQLFLEHVYHEKANALGRALVKLVEKGTNNYHLAWMLILHAIHLLRARPWQLVPVSEAFTQSPLIEARDACARAMKLLDELADETCSYIAERTECCSVSGEVASVIGNHEDACHFFERAEHFASLYEDEEKRNELVSHFIENQGDMLLLTGIPENYPSAIKKYQSISLSIENEPRILAKLYLCFHLNEKASPELFIKADLWKKKMRKQFGTQTSMQILWNIFQEEFKNWKYKDFDSFTSKLQKAVDELFHLHVEEYFELFSTELLFEGDSFLTLKDENGKTLRLELLDWIELDGKEYIVTTGVFMGQFTGTSWFWRVEDSTHPDYNLAFVREKNISVTKKLKKILYQRMMAGESIMTLNIIRFRSTNSINCDNMKSTNLFVKKWYYENGGSHEKETDLHHF